MDKCCYCNKKIELQNEKDLILFCPNCLNIIDEEFADYSFPQCDEECREVVKFYPNKHKQIEWYEKHKEMLYMNENDEKDKASCSFPLFIGVSIALFMFGLIGGVALSMVHILLGIFSFLASFAGGIFIIAKITIKSEDEFSDENIAKNKKGFVPISYYGNEYSFGYVEVNVKDWHSKEKEQIEFRLVEIQKTNIKDVVFDKKTDNYCVLLNETAIVSNVEKTDKLFIPDIFDEEEFNKMIY